MEANQTRSLVFKPISQMLFSQKKKFELQVVDFKIDEMKCDPDTYEEDHETKDLVSHIEEEVAFFYLNLMTQVCKQALKGGDVRIGSILGDQGSARFSQIRTQETGMGNYVADLMVHEFEKRWLDDGDDATQGGGQSGKVVPPLIALLNAGTLRADRVGSILFCCCLTSHERCRISQTLSSKFRI